MELDRGPTLTTRVKALGHALGLDRIGVSSPGESAQTRFLSEWLARRSGRRPSV